VTAPRWLLAIPWRPCRLSSRTSTGSAIAGGLAADG